MDLNDFEFDVPIKGVKVQIAEFKLWIRSEDSVGMGKAVHILKEELNEAGLRYELGEIKRHVSGQGLERTVTIDCMIGATP